MKKILEITTEIDKMLGDLFNSALKHEGLPALTKVNQILACLKTIADPEPLPQVQPNQPRQPRPEIAQNSTQPTNPKV
jgi:hypothetical protein